jgi:hypothetical protein
MADLRSSPSGPAVSPVEVAIQDQFTPSVFRHFYRILSIHSLLSPGTPNDSQIAISGTHSPGDQLLINDGTDVRELGQVLAFSSPIATLDRPLDTAYDPAACEVRKVSYNLAVNGAASPVTFIFEVPLGSTKELDLQSFVIAMVCASQPDDSKFGDLSALTKGVVMRSNYQSLNYFNFINAKTNGEIKEVSDDYEYSDKAGGGAYAFVSRTDIRRNWGVTVRMFGGLRLELIVQDDLSGLTDFHILTRGHVVEP